MKTSAMFLTEADLAEFEADHHAALTEQGVVTDDGSGEEAAEAQRPGSAVKV